MAQLIINYNPFNRTWQASDSYDFMKETVLYEVPSEVIASLFEGGQLQQDKPVDFSQRIEASEQQQFYYLYKGDVSQFRLIAGDKS